MSLSRTIETYGGPFVDAVPVDDPTTTESAGQHNRLTEDVAQATRTQPRAWVSFKTRTTNGAVTPDEGESMMGTGSAQLPTVARTGTGLYTVTYPPSWTDALGTLETIVFKKAHGAVASTTTVGRVQCSVSANVISVLVLSNIAGTDTPSDLTGAQPIVIEAR